MRILKVLKIKYRRENTRASFSDKPALPLVVLMKRFVCFFNSMKSGSQKQIFPTFSNSVKGRQAFVGKGNFSHIVEASLKRGQRK